MRLRRTAFLGLLLLGVAAPVSCNLSTVEDLPSAKDRGPMAPNSGNGGLLQGVDASPENGGGGAGGMGGADPTGGAAP